MVLDDKRANRKKIEDHVLKYEEKLSSNTELGSLDISIEEVWPFAVVH